jgi:hypothetical protein
MSENNALIDTYSKSLIMQYVNKPKAFATIKAFITALMIYDLSIAVRDGYNPATVVGAQADVLGKYLGILRVVKGFILQSSNFSYLLYGQTPPIAGHQPYNRYGNPMDGHFLSYNDGKATYTMTDEEFQTCIAMAIMRHHGNGSLKNIDDILFPVFGASGYLAVETPMGINYFIQANYERIAEMLNGLGFFPRPMSVKDTIEVKLVLSS